MKLTKVLAAALLLGASLSSQAAVISVDWKEAGDNGAFVETTSGTEWLKLTQTQGVGLNTVQQQLGAGGLYEGFRVADSNEVQFLFDYFLGQATGLTYTSISAFDFADSSTVDGRALMVDLLDALGRAIVGTNTFSTGRYFQAGSQSVLSSTFRDDDANGFARLIYDRVTSTTNANTPGSAPGVFLVSDGGNTFSSINNPGILSGIETPSVAVSEPHALALLALGFAGLVLRRKA